MHLDAAVARHIAEHEGKDGGPLGQRAGIGWLGRRSGLFNLLPARLT